MQTKKKHCQVFSSKKATFEEKFTNINENVWNLGIVLPNSVK